MKLDKEVDVKGHEGLSLGWLSIIKVVEEMGENSKGD